MEEYNNNEEIEQIREEDVEEIPPTPIAPEPPKPNFTEAESGVNTAYSYENGDENTAKVLAIVSLVCGVVPILICCLPGIVEGILAVAAVVCGIVSLTKHPSSSAVKGMAIAGIVCGGFAVVFVIVKGIFSIAFKTITDLMDLFV